MAAGTKVGEAYVELQARMSKFESQLKSAEVMTGKSVSKMQANFQAMAPTFKKVGMGMAVAGGAITAALGLTIKSSMSFNKEMANISTLVPGATDRVIELKTEIQTMAVEVGKSTADLAEGAYQVISAFGDSANTVAILEMSARAATAGVASTTEAINLLSAVTKGYGDTSAAAVQKASDLAFQTVTLGQTTFPELAASIGRVIPLAAEMGVKEEELFAVMATGTGVTGKAAEVSTQLRGAIQSLMAPTADMSILLEQEGYASGKAMLAELGLAGSLELVKQRADESNTPLQKYISSIEGQTIALALTGTQADNYTDKLAAMRDAAGLTDVAFKEQTEGINAAGFAFKQAKSRIEVLGQEIGDRLLPMITPLIEKITDLVKKMSDWARAHPGISSAIVKFAAVLGPLLVGLGGLMMLLPGIVSFAPLISAAFHIMLGPVGLVTVAIAGAVAAFLYFYRTNEKFADFINKMGAAIKTFVTNAWGRLVWLTKNWGEVWQTAGQIVTATFKFIGETIWKVLTNKDAFIAFIKLWSTLYASVGKIITDTMVFVGKVIVRASSIIWAPIWESLKWLGEQFTYWFGRIENIIVKAIGIAVNWVTGKFVEFANFITQKVLNPIIGGFESFANAILVSIGWVVEKIIGLFGELPNVILKWLGTSKEEVEQFATDIKEKFEVELGRIPEIAEDALTFEIPQKTLQEPKKFADRMSDAWETIKAQYRAIPGDLKIYLDQLETEWNEITTAAGEFGEAINLAEYKEKLQGLIDKLKDVGVDTEELEKKLEAAGENPKQPIEDLGKAVGKVGEAFINMGEVGKKVTGTTAKFIGVVSDEWRKIIPVVEEVGVFIGEEWERMGQVVITETEKIVKAFTTGWEVIPKAAQDAWQSIVNIGQVNGGKFLSGQKKLTSDVTERWNDMGHELWTANEFIVKETQNEWEKLPGYAAEVARGVTDNWELMTDENVTLVYEWMEEWQKATEVGGKKVTGTTTKFIGVTSDEWRKVTPVVKIVTAHIGEEWEKLGQAIIKETEKTLKVVTTGWEREVPKAHKDAWQDVNNIERVNGARFLRGHRKLTSKVTERWDDMGYEGYRAIEAMVKQSQNEWEKLPGHAAVIARGVVDNWEYMTDKNVELVYEQMEEWEKSTNYGGAEVAGTTARWIGVVSDEWRKVVPVVEVVGAHIGEEWEKIGDNIVETTDSTNEKIKESLKGVLTDITKSFKDSISDWIKEGQTFQTLFANLTQKLADAWVDNFVKELLKTEAIKGVLNTVTGLMGTLSKGILAAASAAWSFGVSAIGAIISGLGSLAAGLWSAITAILSFVVATVKAIAVAVYNALAWIPVIGPALGIAAAIAAVAAIMGLLGTIVSAQAGMPRVPQDMPVMVHKEEAILTAPQAREWRAGRGGSGGDTFQVDLKVNVENGEDLINMTPTQWKRILDNGILPAMQMSAREGRMSKESVGIT